MIKAFTIIGCLFLCVILFSCRYKNPVERNKIVFKDKSIEVRDSLIKLKVLLNKLPNNDGCNINYEWVDELHINDCPGAHNDSIKYYTNKAFSNFNISEKKEFLILVKYLKRNYITGGYLDSSTKIWCFSYRELDDPIYDDSRDIAILNEIDTLKINSLFKVMDHKDLIYLLVPIDAKIR